MTIILNFSLMCFSCWLCYIMSLKMNFGLLQSRRKWLWTLEFFVQVMLIGRIVYIVIKASKYSMKDHRWFTFCFILFMILTEIAPFAFLVYSMIKRLKVYKRARRVLDNFSS